MSDGQLIARFIGEVKRVQAETAEAAMLRPKRDLHGIGEQVGIYQGMQKSLDILDQLISDKLEEEKKS